MAGGLNKVGKVARREKEVQKVLLGRKVRYVGAGGAETSCTKCKIRIRNGIVSVYKDQYYCSESCVLQAVGETDA